MFKVYSDYGYGTLIRTGRAFKSLAAAVNLAKKQPILAEIRMTTSAGGERLCSIFREGIEL